MKLNVGNLESFIRIFIGVVLLYQTLLGNIPSWGYLSILIIATGLGRFSPIKAVLGFKAHDPDATKSEHH